ncbi:hypothetical protein thsps117_41600 [Pseudomonas sp. No.117]
MEWITCSDNPLSPWEKGWGESMPKQRSHLWKRLRRFPRYGSGIDEADRLLRQPPLPLGEGWGEGMPRATESPVEKAVPFSTLRL